MTRTNSTITLADLADVNPRVRFDGLTPDALVSFIPMADLCEGGGWVNRQVRRLQDVRFGYTPFAEGDVLFAKITPCMENGKGAHATSLANRVGFGTTELHVLRARGENDARFLYHWLQASPTRTRAVAFMGGSAGQQRVQADFFAHFRIPAIPSEEQGRIAAILDLVDAAMEKTAAVIAKLKRVRIGLLNDLLTHGLDDNGELRDPIRHPDQFGSCVLGIIPKSWTCSPLLEATDWYSGGTPSRSESSWWTGPIPFVTPKDMKRFVLSDTIEHVTPIAVASGSRLMDAETVFIVVRGMILAHTFPVCISTRPFAFNQDLKAVRGRGSLSNRYLAHWFAANANNFLRRATEATHGTKKLDKSEIARVHIAVPRPEEQEEIVRLIDQADAQLAIYSDEARKLEAFKNGMTADLLTGCVRVPGTIEVGATL